MRPYELTRKPRLRNPYGTFICGKRGFESGTSEFILYRHSRTQTRWLVSYQTKFFSSQRLLRNSIRNYWQTASVRRLSDEHVCPFLTRLSSSIANIIRPGTNG